MEHINWLGVGLAGLAVFIIGALWYGLIFSKLYRRELGVPSEPTSDGDTGPKPAFFIVQFISALVMAAALAFFLGEATLIEGLIAGLVAGVFLSAAQEQLFQAEGKSRTILFLHEGYFLVAMVAAGAILASFQ